jgi:hypothetical protein
MKKISYLSLALISLYLISRLYVWVFKPTSFSEIIYSYMPYAHLWASGVKPYREQWFEYPPATIPLFYIPHLVDMSTHPTPFHLNYSDSYRGILLIVDLALFTLIWKVLRKQKVPQMQFVLAILYYITITAKAHDFLYDTMDLTFTAAMTLGVAAPILFTSQFGQFTSWFGFFLASALKYVNLPLAPLYALLERHKPKQMLIAAVVGAALVWGVPLALYRSSLLVSLVYQNIRGVQIDTAAAVIIRTADRFTHSEHVIEVFKNYEIAGPITEKAKVFLKYFFPLSIAIYLLWCARLILKSPQSDSKWLRIHITLGYVLLFMVTAKVLSTPFLLWHIPLLAIYPFKNWRTQACFLGLSLAIIFTSMARVSNMEVWFLTLPIIIGWIRTVCFTLLLMLWLQLKKVDTVA